MKIRIKATANTLSPISSKIVKEMKTLLAKADYEVVQYPARMNVLDFDVLNGKSVVGKVSVGTLMDVFQFTIVGKRVEPHWHVGASTSSSEIRRKLGEFLVALDDKVENR